MRRNFRVWRGPGGGSGGVREVDAIQKEILQLGNFAIRPPYHPAIAPCQIDGRTVLVIWALGGQARPYKARLSLGKDGRDWAYFIRKGSSTVRAKERDQRAVSPQLRAARACRGARQPGRADCAQLPRSGPLCAPRADSCGPGGTAALP
jgi:hypothetical protein